MLPHLPTQVHLKITSYLLNNSFANDNEIFSILAELHLNLLKDENPLALHEALQCFSRVSKVPSNNELMKRVAGLIRDKPEINQLVSSFVAKKPARTVDNVGDYLERIMSFEDSHVCVEKSQLQGRQEKVQKLDNGRCFEQQEIPVNRPINQRQEVRVPNNSRPVSNNQPRQQQNDKAKEEDPDDFVAGIISDLKRATKMKSKMDAKSLKQLKVACAKFIDSDM